MPPFCNQDGGIFRLTMKAINVIFVITWYSVPHYMRSHLNSNPKFWGRG